ncbi:Rossmann-fold NAD(P)-binding domain-containing protein [Haloechinothrix halophila]|uniref:hypothetical protein n=1 Tax=Haloechinothrix halophila TaxID=1069073 RepID=UPI0006886BE6|nr:hypothetical protein [Haloechinothrix halophila]
MSSHRALILGGTGMLSGVAGWLAGQDWHVVVPSRRYCPIPVDEVHGRVSAEPPRGRVRWVEARWERPERLAQDAARALGGPTDLLVSWVHSAYRVPVLNAVTGLLAEDAPVVEVHGDSGPPGEPEPALSGHPTQRVVLGYVREGTSTRWLTHAEIVDGVLVAVRRALADRPLTEHHVGETAPRPAH